MMFVRISSGVFSIAAVILITIADHRNIIKLTKIECLVTDEYAKYVTNLTCNVKSLSRLRSIINVHTFLMKPFSDVFINVQIHKKNSYRYLPFMVNATTDICKLLDGTAMQSFYTKYIFDWIKRYSNVNHTCPYEGLLFAENLEAFGERIPIFAPAGDYRLDLNFYEHNFKHLIATVKGYGTVQTRLFMDPNLNAGDRGK